MMGKVIIITTVINIANTMDTVPITIIIINPTSETRITGIKSTITMTIMETETTMEITTKIGSSTSRAPIDMSRAIGRQGLKLLEILIAIIITIPTKITIVVESIIRISMKEVEEGTLTI